MSETMIAALRQRAAQEAMVSVEDDALDEVSLQDEDAVEFRIFMAYAQRNMSRSNYQDLLRRNFALNRNVSSNGEGPVVTDGSSASPKKEKNKKKSLRRIFTPKCLRPQRDKEKIAPRSLEDNDDVRMRGVVRNLSAIVKALEKQDHERVEYRTCRRMSSVEHDGDGEEKLIEDIVAFLREEGDKINAKIIQEQSLLQRLRNFWSYDFFQTLTETYVERMVPASEAEDVQQSRKIALCVHATTKLTAIGSHPMNKMFGFGSRYLKENYSQWIKDHGGWENAIENPDAPENEEEE
ncbi:apoptosis facilitator Bcl-2-like protein 14 isoform X2 [Dendrobates tinctorius]|uniref:apoptosis facilitator Bcl-2-like protein 14 isoform X2 n=1 Tax=Dendrobates tinctorius TaxID=92724 RepID=UPI003CC9A7DC